MKTQTKKIIVVGQIVSTELYGLGRGVVCSINGEQSQYGQDKNVGGVIRQGGGNAKFDIAFFNGERSRFIPECILRSAQWSIHEDVATADAVKMAIEYTDVIAEKNWRKRNWKTKGFPRKRKG